MSKIEKRPTENSKEQREWFKKYFKKIADDYKKLGMKETIKKFGATQQVVANAVKVASKKSNKLFDEFSTFTPEKSDIKSSKIFPIEVTEKDLLKLSDDDFVKAWDVLGLIYRLKKYKDLSEWDEPCDGIII